MNLNAMIRGQSNALLMIEDNGWAGYGAIVGRVQQLLGFDGVNDTVSLEYARDTGNGANTVNSGTAFLTEWIAANGGDWRNGWQTRGLEQGLLNYVNALSAAQKADPTAVVWLHNEYDSTNGGLTPEEWASGVRFDAGLVRQAFGKSAADLPYLFVSAIPYWGTQQGHQAIRIGMEDLAADAGFNAAIAARAIDLDMSYNNLDDNWSTTDFGGPHISSGDGRQTAERIALSLAQQWADYAKPGSAVALANGQVDDLGPRVVQASVAGDNQLLLKVGFDAASRLGALDSDAAHGVGWSVQTAAGTVNGTAAQLTGADTLLVTFDGAVAGGTLFYGYGYGYGRLAGADGSGQGNAVYDDKGQPIWVEARGLAVGGGVVDPPEPGHPPEQSTAGSGPDTLVLRLAQDYWQGDAQYIVSIDGAQLGGTFTASALSGSGQADTLTLRGDWGPGSHQVVVRFLNDAWGGTAATDRNLDIVSASYNGQAVAGAAQSIDTDSQPGGFAFTEAATGTPGQKLTGTASAERLAGGAGADILNGMEGADTLAGAASADLLRGGRGADLLMGGQGDNTLMGGGGADRFAFAQGGGHDTVLDFHAGHDRLAFGAGITAASLTRQATAEGLLLTYDATGDSVLLAGVASIADADMVFA